MFTWHDRILGTLEADPGWHSLSSIASDYEPENGKGRDVMSRVIYAVKALESTGHVETKKKVAASERVDQDNPRALNSVRLVPDT